MTDKYNNSIDHNKVPEDIFDEDRLHEECAIFGISGYGFEVARYAYYGLYAMQHRGQESAGIAVASSEHIIYHKDMGLVSRVFGDEETMRILKGKAAIGHVRYSTTGSSKKQNAQPFLFDDYDGFHLAIAHNGNIVNVLELKEILNLRNISTDKTSDTALVGLLLQDEFKKTGDIVNSIRKVMSMCRGAYCFVIITTESVFAVRDAYGVRPLSLGRVRPVPGKDVQPWVVASESCAFNIINADFVKEVAPGTIVELKNNQLFEYPLALEGSQKFCIFELIYFARPDSIIMNRSIQTVREQMGRILFREKPIEADVVIPVPDSGIPAGIGYAIESGIRYGMGFIKNHYVGRTFIMPYQEARERSVYLKLSPIPEIIKDKRVVMIDDSIVRGTNSKRLVKMLRDAGAKEVHVRISSPPIRYPCYYGLDFGTYNELIAGDKSQEEIRKIIDADSLYYLSIPGLTSAINVDASKFCLACFNGEYPIPISHQETIGKMVLEEHSNAISQYQKTDTVLNKKEGAS